jgi:hypothetical protein
MRGEIRSPRFRATRDEFMVCGPVFVYDYDEAGNEERYCGYAEGIPVEKISEQEAAGADTISLSH